MKPPSLQADVKGSRSHAPHNRGQGGYFLFLKRHKIHVA